MKILAKVDNYEITTDDYRFFLESLSPEIRRRFDSSQINKEIVDELISQQLLYIDALDKGLENDEEFKKILQKTKESLLKTYALGKLMDSVEVSDDEIASFYNQRAEFYDEGERVEASHILVADEDKANDIYKKINKDNFEELARENSTCPSKQNGGNLGVFSKGQMVKEFEDAAFSMQEGEISKPVKTDFGYHIIKLNKKFPQKKYTLNDVIDKVRVDAKRYKEHKTYVDLINKLNKEHKVEVVNYKEAD